MGHIEKREKNRIGKRKYLKASSVIEMIIIHTVFYYHDKAVIYGAAGETAAVGAQEERKKENVCDLESFFRERVKGKLIYLKDTEVSVMKTSDEITVSVSAPYTT